MSLSPVDPTALRLDRGRRPPVRSMFRFVVRVVAVNGAILLALLVPVELVFGTWIRPMGLGDLKRFSVPIGARFEFDTTALYGDGSTNVIHYSRDSWGLRGSHQSLESIDVLAVGGSTTEQRHLDDNATWQAVAQQRLSQTELRLVIANAGVDGQSTVGHLFNFDFWFPALHGLKPSVVLFYLGINDVLRHERRVDFDSTVDASSWRTRSATYQLLRTVRSNLRARSVGVNHRRRRELRDDDYTDRGLLSDAQRESVANAVASSFLHNVELLQQRVRVMGASPVFMTQTAFAWSGNPDEPPRGLKETITVHGVTVNYADVSFLHQELNRRLVAHCREKSYTCFDLARDVAFDENDYYDYVHNTPAGAAKIGEYLAGRLQGLEITARAVR